MFRFIILRILRISKIISNKNHNNKNLSENNKNMKRSEIILPGHYCLKSTLDAEVKQIIRIIGKANRDGYWITDEHKEIPEYVLLDSYVALDTVASQPKQKFGKDIFGDFTPVHIDTEDDEIDGEEEDEIETKQKLKQNNNGNIILTDEQFEKLLKHNSNGISVPNNCKTSNESSVVNKPSNKYHLDEQTLSIIRKAEVVTLNDNHEKKYGDRPYKYKNLQVTIELPIVYEMNKLRQIIELFELDERKIAEFIAHQIKIDYHKITDLVYSELASYQKQIENITQQATHQPIKEENIQKKLESGINDVENLLQKYIEN